MIASLPRVLGRLGQAVLVLFGVYTGSFILLYLLPSDALTIFIESNSGGNVVANSAQLKQARAQLGLNGSAFEQYLRLLTNILQGKLGTSIATGERVSSMIASAAPQTLQLGAAALVLAALGGVLLGYATAFARSSRLRAALLALPPLGVSFPTFAVGLLLMDWLSFQWGWLPSGGSATPLALVLPAITLAIPNASVIAQVFARSLLTELRVAYIDTAYAKGASRRRVLLAHATRNAVAPTLAVSGIIVGNLMAGSVIVETVFYRDGLGTVIVNAVNAQDSPVVLALALISAAVFVAVNLVVDLSLPLIDKRIGRKT